MTTLVAQCALECWRASGERTEARLLELVTFFDNIEHRHGDHH